MEQTGKLDAAGEISDFDAPDARRAEPPDDSPSGIAVGEPPLMLAISVWLAIRDAIASVADYRLAPLLDAPATPERVLAAIDDLRSRTQN